MNNHNQNKTQKYKTNIKILINVNLKKIKEGDKYSHTKSQPITSVLHPVSWTNSSKDSQEL